MAEDDLEKLLSINQHGNVSNAKEVSIELFKSGTGPLVKVYNIYKRERLERFFRAVYLEVETESDRDKLNEALNTEVGREILVDYVDRVTSSLCGWSRHALAMMFSDELLQVHSPRFHRYAAKVLPSLSEHEISLFLTLADFIELHEPMPAEIGVPLYSIRLQHEIFEGVQVGQLAEDLEEFQQRGLVVRDFSPGRFGGGPPSIIIGWPERCDQLAKLLKRAAKYIDNNEQ